MKVLYVTGMYSAKYGGLEKFNIELLKRDIRLSIIYKHKNITFIGYWMNVNFMESCE